MIRRTPLRPSLEPIARNAPLRSTRRKRKCYTHLRSKPFKDWARETHRCAVEGKDIVPGVRHRCAGVLEFAHIQNEGTGGADRGNGLILCTEAHTAAPWSWHRDGWLSFQRRFGIDARAIARALDAEYSGDFQ